ncbi:MAG TPA: tRNA (N6-threonylcarbamoyladenosine(37)-N6)-methyltransferase TrmO [Methanoregulaceae archaeon]|nr:tRNA (N6-threonylcarbamoyladenosine(37)-N6)-methyltransferase TrmO [Methanoregulaceae archaeon]
MMTGDIRFVPIGTIHSPWKTGEGMPIQPCYATGVRGSVTVFSEYMEGLRDLAGFSRIYLIYHFHRSHGYNLEVTPFLDTIPRGVFSTRAPRRPNPLGISIVKLTGVHDCTLDIEDIDIIDGTPLIDIKPYIPEFDCHPRESSGWLKNSDAIKEAKADRRFIDKD